MDTTRTAARTARLAAYCAVATTVLAATSGCGTTSLITHEKSQHFDTVADAPTEGDLAFRLPEDVIPEDATDITVRVKTDDANLKAYDWASESGQLPPDCQSSGESTEVDPFYASGNWPAEVTKTADYLCGEVLVITEVDGHYYAWHSA